MSRLATALLFATQAFAWTEAFAQGERVPGTIIFEHDTLNVKILLPEYGHPDNQEGDSLNWWALQSRVVFVDPNNNQRMISPADANEIRFTYKKKQVRMVSRTFKWTSSFRNKFFLRVVADGPVSLYRYYFIETAGFFPRPVQYSYVLQKRGDETFSVAQLENRRRQVKYFSDCPELARKINENELDFLPDIEKILGYYNDQCANRH